MADWSKLHPDLLVEIIRRLKLYEDFLAIGSVCTSWRSVAIMEKSRFISNLTPWLMLAPDKGSDLRSFFSFSEDVTRHVMLPEVQDNFKTPKRCFSSRGWLITIAQDLRMTLLHPFSRFQIELPHMNTLKNSDDISIWLSAVHITFVSRFVLSSNPFYISDCVVMGLHGSRGRVAYSKPGDRSWTIIETYHRNFDVIYYKGLFYIINSKCQIMACDIRSNVAVQVAQMPSDLLVEFPRERLYIVESVGAFLVVSRRGAFVRPIEGSSTKLTYGVLEFHVFEVDLRNNTWTKITNLGNRALFLGYNSSFSIEATHCKSNCIYFADKCFDSYFYTRNGGGKDMGIYNMVDGSIEPHFKGNSYSRVNPPMWVEPSYQ